MKSRLTKVLHKIAGKPIITYVTDTCQNAGIDDITVVIAPDGEQVAQIVSPLKTAIQQQALGTGHAVLSAEPFYKDFDGFIFILNGDTPFVQPETLHHLYETAQKTGMAVLGFEPENPTGYGRLKTENNSIQAIIEDKDCTVEEREIGLCNAGVYCIEASKLFSILNKISNNNAQGEYYLTDSVALAAQQNIKCCVVIADEVETIGINSRAQLADAEAIMQHKLRQKAFENGVTMIDPLSVTLSHDTQIAADVTLEPNIFIGENVSIGMGTIIHAFSHLEGVRIGENVSIGPFARLRPQSKIGDYAAVGNFCEVNRSELKAGAKSKHMSYLGDATIGEKTNIGAGTVIANYDGFDKNQTIISEQVFVGSNSTLIAPLKVDKGAIIAAGSVITEDVDANAMAVARSRQTTLDGWAKDYRDKKKKS